VDGANQPIQQVDVLRLGGRALADALDGPPTNPH
jgi:hypothetical protein